MLRISAGSVDLADVVDVAGHPHTVDRAGSGKAHLLGDRAGQPLTSLMAVYWSRISIVDPSPGSSRPGRALFDAGAEIGLCPLPVRDVAEDEDAAGRAALLVQDRAGFLRDRQQRARPGCGEASGRDGRRSGPGQPPRPGASGSGDIRPVGLEDLSEGLGQRFALVPARRAGSARRS